MGVNWRKMIGIVLVTLVGAMAANAQTILVWDLDLTPSSASYIAGLYEELGYEVTYEDDSEFNRLNQYQYVYLALGINFENYVIETGSLVEARLVNYLEGGGNLIVEGGDFGYDQPANLFPYFHVNFTNDGEGDLARVIGDTGTWAQGMTIRYGGPNNFLDHLEAGPDAERIFYNPFDDAGIAVIYDGGYYKTALFAFEVGRLEDDPDPNNRTELLIRLMEWFGPEVSAPYGVIGELNPETGEVILSWEFTTEPELEFEEFRVYRNNSRIGTTPFLWFFDQLEEYGDYEYTVSARYTNGMESIRTGPVVINWGDVIADPPTPFYLLSPTDNSVITRRYAHFSWTSSTDPDTDVPVNYRLELSNRPDFRLIDHYSVGADTHCTIWSLRDDREYWWRVRALDTNTGGTLSEFAYRFRTEFSEPPSDFYLTSPTNGAELVQETQYAAVFSWGRSVDPDPEEDVTYDLIFELIHEDGCRDTSSVTGLEANWKYISVAQQFDRIFWEVPLRVNWWVEAVSGWDRVHSLGRNWVELGVPLVGADDGVMDVPESFELSSVYPNPFNNMARVQVAVPETGQVTIDLYNVLGQRVMQISDGVRSVGVYEVEISGASLGSGMYFLRATHENCTTKLQKIILSR